MDRDQLACRCAEIEKAGGSVLEFLRECGCISPWGTWFRLQKEELGRANHEIKDGKGAKRMGKLTLEQKKQAVEIALNGISPLPFLRKCGSSNPEALWYTIKQDMRAIDPDKYALLPDLRNMKPAEEAKPVTQEKGPAVAQEGIQDAEAVPLPYIPVPAKPLNYDGFDVTGLRTSYGEFRVSNNGYLFFGSSEKDELEMPVELWQKFAADLPRVMTILGISAKN